MSEQREKKELGSYFWNDKSFEPKRNFRWLLKFDDLVNHIPPHYVKNVKKPSFTINSKRVQGIGYAINVAQQVQYQPVEITLIDDQKNTVTDFIYYYFNYAGNDFSGKQGAQTCINTNKAKNKTRNIELWMLNHNGIPIEIWTLYGAWISSFTQSDLSYENSDLATYTMTITYDYFQYGNNDFSSTYKKDTIARASRDGLPPTEEERYNADIDLLTDNSSPNIKELEKIHGSHNAD